MNQPRASSPIAVVRAEGCATSSAEPFALVTPTFRDDFERCELLVETVHRWVSPETPHYLIVDRRDLPLFRPLESRRTRLLAVEDILPWWIRRIPGVQRIWLSLRSLPIRNWILQQIVKLSVACTTTAEVLFYVDSDVFFSSPFEPVDWLRDGRAPLFVQRGRAGLIANNDRWHAVAARLIGLPPDPSYDTNFIGNVVCWRRDNVLRLHERVQTVARRDWQAAVASQLAFSEYILYGLFVTRSLAESGHWPDPVEHTLCYWGTRPLDEGGLLRLRDEQEKRHHSVMVSAKSRTPVALIRRVFRPAS